MNSTNKNNASSTAAKEKQSFFRSNPVINRLNKVEERAGYDEKAAGYGRITIKTAFFLLVTVAGMMAYLVMNATIFANQPQELAFNYNNHSDHFRVCKTDYPCYRHDLLVLPGLRDFVYRIYRHQGL